MARWRPGFTHCVAAGDRRNLSLIDGSQWVERQLERDETAMCYDCTLEQGSLPVSDDYRATLLVTDRGGSTVVSWRAGLTPGAEMSEATVSAVLGRMFAAGLDGLQRRLGG